MRFFALKHDTGETKYLDGKSGIFLDSPTGLGVTFDNDAEQLANLNFFIGTSSREKQASIAGAFVFTGNNPYFFYKRFVDWLFESDPLYFLYMPDDKLYTRRVRVAQISKTEISAGGWLRVPFSLECLTPWYTETSYSGRTGKTTIGTGDYSVLVDIPSLSVKLVQPVVSFEDYHDGEVARCALSNTVSAGSSFIYSNDPLDAYVRSGTRGSEEDNLPYVDFTGKPFTFSPGKDVRVNVSDSEGAAPAYNLTVRKYWRTV